LQQLIESLVPDIRATNEPKRQKCGAPDYIITRKDIPVGFIEAKDIGDRDLAGAKKTGNKEQFDRYKASLGNLIFTDYLEFHLYRDAEFITKISIAELVPLSLGGALEIKVLPENISAFENLIKEFCAHKSQTIKSSKKLAEMMAGKARLLSDVIERALTRDEDKQEDSSLKDQKQAFKQILIHDITPKGFADVYAQTIAYGMFAARLHDPSLDTFSRQEAAELIPKSNPFLRKLFGYIAGPDIDDRIRWIVDDLVNIFLACNVDQILKNYGKTTKTEDPIIHFYETFLSEYDPKLRKARGVWYTPAPVVNFIVRAVDDILKSEFNLLQGLADTSKTTIKQLTQSQDKRTTAGYKEMDVEVHRVQILDPATGTGTFLAEVVKHIHHKFEGQQGIWSNYVENHLIPRLNGFELLMASYAMAHLKLDLLLTDTGYKPTSHQRLRVFLTNSLEQASNEVPNLFMAQWLTEEAQKADFIKRDTPVMCVMGNPPYAVSSTNKSEWIQSLIADYKKDLNERKINLDDDYIKFIRYGQHFIDKNGSGILAYISNNSFIDGITHRQMRKHLLESFDKIYILDLHGNAKKQEVCPDGSKDENVFDIMQGVSINLFVKTGTKAKGELGKVFHFDLFGKRDFKYEMLSNNQFSSIDWMNLDISAPYYFFIPKNFISKEDYNTGFKIDELFNIYSTGAESQKDEITIHFNKNELNSVLSDFRNLSESEIAQKYKIIDGRDWKISSSQLDVKNYHDTDIIQYRPFDKRITLFSGKSKGFFAYTRFECLKNMKRDNIAITAVKLNRKYEDTTFWISKLITDKGIASSLDNSYVFPLYLYPETNAQYSLGETPTRVPNLNMDIVNKIADGLGLSFVPEPTNGVGVGVGGRDAKFCVSTGPTNNMGTTHDTGANHPNDVGTDAKFCVSENHPNEFSPIDLLDYIYAVLHSP
ncbi:MAG: type ISP restriction/modification enzyme, partial [Bacteroidales bacterium]